MYTYIEAKCFFFFFFLIDGAYSQKGWRPLPQKTRNPALEIFSRCQALFLALYMYPHNYSS